MNSREVVEFKGEICRVVKASSRVVKEFEGGEGKIEDGEGIQGWWWNLRVVKAKSRVVKEFESGESIQGQ